jgi:hypothetical protein
MGFAGNGVASLFAKEIPTALIVSLSSRGLSIKGRPLDV